MFSLCRKVLSVNWSGLVHNKIVRKRKSESEKKRVCPSVRPSFHPSDLSLTTEVFSG